MSNLTWLTISCFFLLFLIKWHLSDPLLNSLFSINQLPLFSNWRYIFFMSIIDCLNCGSDSLLGFGDQRDTRRQPPGKTASLISLWQCRIECLPTISLKMSKYCLFTVVELWLVIASQVAFGHFFPDCFHFALDLLFPPTCSLYKCWNRSSTPVSCTPVAPEQPVKNALMFLSSNENKVTSNWF